MDIDINDASSGEAKAFASTLSPRTSYALQKRRADYLTMDIMMNLDADSIGEIRKEFERKENNVDMFEFVRIMKNALPEELEVRDVSGGSDEQQDGLGLVRRKPSSAELVANLVELFREIDLNGDHLMDWTEVRVTCCWLFEAHGCVVHELCRRKGGWVRQRLCLSTNSTLSPDGDAACW